MLLVPAPAAVGAARLPATAPAPPPAPPAPAPRGNIVVAPSAPVQAALLAAALPFAELEAPGAALVAEHDHAAAHARSRVQVRSMLERWDRFL
jgi:hypothetical protein